MATPVTFNGVAYSVPAFGDVGYAQGPGNLSSYLIALASGTLQASGGLFSLTAQANFGPNFGLTAVNFTSTTANPATAGSIRLAKTDTIDWRNNANTLNLALGINGSDQLTFNGSVIGLVGSSVTSVSGTANQINSTGGTTPVLSLSSTLIIPGTFTIPAVTNQIILGTTNTVTLTSPAPAASRVYTIPDVLGAASFVMTAGAQSIAGVKTFTGGAGGITMSGSTIAMGTGAITGSGNITFSPTTAGIVGTTTNDAAATGNVGQYISSVAGGTAFGATDVYTDLTSISLTAGDWDVLFLWSGLDMKGVTTTLVAIGIGTISLNNAPNLQNTNPYLVSTGLVITRLSGVSAARASLASTTTIYAKIYATYSGVTPTCQGTLSARRVR